MSFKTNLGKVIDILKQGHCTGYCAKDVRGNPCDPNSDKAIQWCIYGACHKIFKFEQTMEYVKFLDALREKLSVSYLSTWNNKHKEEVIPTLERLYNELQD